ncbi:MAG: hypothetical protein Q9227_006933 [Pyrenula ochraceoflavens]
MFRRRHMKPVLAVFLTLCAALIYLKGDTIWNIHTPQIIFHGDKSLDYDLAGQRKVWHALKSALDLTFPRITSLQRHGKLPPIGFDKINDTFERPDYVVISKDDVIAARAAHSSFINQSDTVPSLVFNPRSRGIVSTAGGAYLPVFVISLRMLRRIGSTLPVEVFLADTDESSARISRYQYKIFAILFSSFEQLLFLDADSFPIHNPDVLFDSDPFKSTGLVTWPDFWIDGCSRFYYDIIGKEVPPLTVRASTESGEILVSKVNHRNTLLLSTYYNWYGPGMYYPLLGQGVSSRPGEGDKDTFLTAALASNEKFYAVHEYIRPLGRRKFEDGMSEGSHDASGKIAGSAMVQHDPIEDFQLTSSGTIARLKDDNGHGAPGPKGPKPFFIHAHFPKFNPATVFDDHGDGVQLPTKGIHGEDVRAWVAEERTVRDLGYDVERAYWEEIKWVACELEDVFRDWKQRKGICQRVQKYWNTVYGKESDEIR